MAISDWNKNKVLKFTIDNTTLDEQLTNFPILLNIGSATGIDNFDSTTVFDDLTTSESVTDTELGFLVHTDGADGTTAVTDSSANEFVITTGGTVAFSNEYSKFSSTSLKFNGLTTDVLTTPTSDFWGFGLEDFTIDCWLRLNSTTFTMLRIDSYTTGLSICCSNTTFYIGLGGIWPSKSITLPLNTWFHIAVVRKDESDVKVFVNGVEEGFWDGDFTGRSIATSSVTYFGVDSGLTNNKLNGYMEELRVVKGRADWWSDFTPPTQPYDGTHQIISNNNKKIAVVYPSVQEHLVTVSGVPTYQSYIHGETEQCFCEIAYWDETNKEAQLWAKIPKVLASQPTDFYLYYDKTQEDNTYYIGDVGDVAGQQVWSNGYEAVYHMNSLTITDSTSNESHGTPVSMDVDNLTSNSAGIAIDFNDSEYINLPNDSGLHALGDFTVEALVSSNALSSVFPGYNATIFTNFDDGNSKGLSCMFTNDGQQALKLLDRENSGSVVSADQSWTDGSLYFVTFTLENNTKQEIWRNDILVASGTNSWTYTKGVDAPMIGKEATDYQWNGTMNTVRIASEYRNASWVKTSNYNLIDSLCTVISGSKYSVGGYVTEYGEAVQRDVFLYDRISGQLMDKTTSNINGYYLLNTTFSGSHNLICLDAGAAPDFDDLIISKVIPTEVI